MAVYEGVSKWILNLRGVYVSTRESLRYVLLLAQYKRLTGKSTHLNCLACKPIELCTAIVAAIRFIRC